MGNWFYIVDSCMYVNSTKGMRCCIYMVKQVRERTVMLRNAYIVSFVTVCVCVCVCVLFLYPRILCKNHINGNKNITYHVHQ